MGAPSSAPPHVGTPTTVAGARDVFTMPSTAATACDAVTFSASATAPDVGVPASGQLDVDMGCYTASDPGTRDKGDVAGIMDLTMSPQQARGKSSPQPLFRSSPGANNVIPVSPNRATPNDVVASAERKACALKITRTADGTGVAPLNPAQSVHESAQGSRGERRAPLRDPVVLDITQDDSRNTESQSQRADSRVLGGSTFILDGIATTATAAKPITTLSVSKAQCPQNPSNDDNVQTPQPPQVAPVRRGRGRPRKNPVPIQIAPNEPPVQFMCKENAVKVPDLEVGTNTPRAAPYFDCCRIHILCLWT
jgi:hypothetical protein